MLSGFESVEGLFDLKVGAEWCLLPLSDDATWTKLVWTATEKMWWLSRLS